MKLSVLAVTVATASIAASSVRAACECGYKDPSTLLTWTDATISYFNETGVDDLVVPARSPRIYGALTEGDSGDGQQSWAVVGDHVNEYEDSFGAEYRSAISYNNTYVTDQALGLAMQVSPANPKTHVVNGSAIVSRRRDILHGTFRSMISMNEYTGAGMGFRFSVAFNESETIDTNLFLSDSQYNASTTWSFSATGLDAGPIKNNQSYFNATGPLEHRMDWLNDKEIQFRTSTDNASVAFHSFVKGRNTTNIPSTPAPMSFFAWANGEPSESQGPPMTAPMITHIVYVRSFYNSSLPSRNQAFEQQCATALNVDRYCSTDDYTLRNSTEFSQEAVPSLKKIKKPFVPPIWAVIPTCFFTAIFVAIIIHAVLLNRTTDKAIRLAKMQQEQQEHDEEPRKSTDTSASRSSSMKHLTSSSSASAASKAFLTSIGSSEEDALEVPELYSDWDDSDEDDEGYDSEDIEDVEQLGPEFGARRPSRRRPSMMPRNAVEAAAIDPYGGQSDFVASPQPTLGKYESYRYGTMKDSGSDSGEGKIAKPGIVQAGFANPFGYSASSNAGSQRRAGTQPFHMRPTIIHWKGRHDADVGRLAEPIGPPNATHRLSVAAVQTSFFVMMFQKMRGLVFVSRKGGPTTSTGERRIDYLDGMRGFACLGVSMGHFFLMFYGGVTNDVAPHHYPTMEFWLRIVIGPLVLNAGLLLGVFFLLPARTMCQRYLLKGGLSSMADSTVRRLPRLMLPVLGACLVNYFMIDLDAYKWVRRLASRTWTTWAYYQNYKNVLVFVNAYITLWWAAPPDDPALVTGYATGVLWTIPLIVQGLWTCMLCALVAHEIKRPWKRFTFYAICIVCSWYANTWDLFFMGGLVIADLDANIKYRELSNKGIPLYFIKKRINGAWLAWIFFLACCVEQWIQYIPTAPKSAILNLREKGIKSDLRSSEQYIWNPTTLVYAYQDPIIFAWLWVMSMFILADLSPAFQTIWRLRIWRWLGTHAMAFYLCHGIIFWTWGAWCTVALLSADVPYWAAILITFLSSYLLLGCLAVAFTSTFEHWAMLFSKSFWRATSGHYGRKV